MRLSKKTKLVILLLMSSSIIFIYKYTNHNNITYTDIGDSLSIGIDSYGKKTYSYSNYVKEYLKDTNKLKNYYNQYSLKEMTIEKLHYALLTNEKVKVDNKNKNIKQILHETDYLTISVGLNDILEKVEEPNDLKELNKTMKKIEKSFNMFIKELRKIYNRDIYIIGYYKQNINNKNYNKYIEKLNDIYKKNKEVIYISTDIISENKSVFLSNPSNYYPNYKGYQVISSKIIDKITKKLEK